MKKILIVVEKGKDGIYSVYSPTTEFTVLNGQGATVEDAITDMKEALQEVIESYLEAGENIPAELTGNIEFEYKYVPNDETIEAINDARAKKGMKANSIDELFDSI
jgi:predicted RNase H-like HicB family nuclease